MVKPLKILLLLIAALFVLTMSVVIILPFIIDPNDYKPQMIAFVKGKTGRVLEIPGDITLSLFPWLGISTGKIVLRNYPGFQDRAFATIEEGDIKVKLIPLLTNNIQISRIVLKGLNLNLIKNRQGASNWDDLLSLGRARTDAPEDVKINRKVPETTSGGLAALAIGGISIEQAHIDWDDQKSGKHVELTELNLKTNKFTFGQPVDIDASFLIAHAGAKPVDFVGLSSQLRTNHSFESIDLTNLELNYSRRDGAIPDHSMTAVLSVLEIAFDHAGQSLKMKGVRIDSGDLHIDAEFSGNHMIDNPTVQGLVKIARFNPAQWLKQMNFTVPDMRDKKAFSELAFQFNLMANAEKVDIQQLAGRLDDTRIKGAINDLAQPKVGFELSLDAIDADRYMPAKSKADRPLATPAVALAAVLSKLPADTLRQLNVNGELLLDQLKINGLTMQGMRFKLNGNEGVVTSSQSIQKIYQGSYNGNLNLKLRDGQPSLALNEKIEQVRLGPLLKDLNGRAKISGVFNATTHMQGQGRNSKELQSGLSGQLDFHLKDAAVKGFDLQKIIDSVMASNKRTSRIIHIENDQTVFSEITGTANLSRGVVQNNDLVARSSRFRVEGAGSVNLNTEGLDYKMTAKLIKKQATPEEPEQFHSTPVIIHIGGTFDQPSYSLDVSALLTEKNKAKIEKLLDKKKEKIDKLLDKLDKKLGPGASDLIKGIF